MPKLIVSKEVQTSPQYAAVNDYAIQTTTSLDETIDKFSGLVESKAASGDDEVLSEALNLSWKSITSLAADTAFTEPGMQRLVDFVLELQNRSDVEVDGKARVVEGMKLWSDLPLFGWQMRDAWNFGNAIPPAEDESMPSLIENLHSTAGR